MAAVTSQQSDFVTKMERRLSFTTLFFSSFTGPGDFWSLSINLSSGEVDVVTLVQKTLIKLNNRERGSIEKQLLECHIEEWEDKYERSFYDGFRWSLSLCNGDTEIKGISGENEYPPRNQWQPFINLILRLYDRTIKEGKTEVFPSINTPCGTDKEK